MCTIFPAKTWGDFKTFGDGRDTKEKLADSESAMKLHEKLKELYGLCWYWLFKQDTIQKPPRSQRERNLKWTFQNYGEQEALSPLVALRSAEKRAYSYYRNRNCLIDFRKRVNQAILLFGLSFSYRRGTLNLPHKFISYSTQKRCAFLSLVKMQALFWHTSLRMLNLCGSKELAFFGAWLRAAHFFILPKIKIRWYLRWKAKLESINLILNLALMI